MFEILVMDKWKKQTLKLKANQRWRAKPGYQICVIGRGAVRFDFPQGWIMEPDEVSFKFYDRPHPDDDIRLEVSYNRIPPVDWSGLPLAQLLDDIVAGEHREVTSKGEITSIERDDLRLVWTEIVFQDPVEKRAARSRICIAIGTAVQALIALDYWPEDAGRAVPAWDEALRTLKLEQYVGDPTRGDVQKPRLN